MIIDYIPKLMILKRMQNFIYWSFLLTYFVSITNSFIVNTTHSLHHFAMQVKAQYLKVRPQYPLINHTHRVLHTNCDGQSHPYNHSHGLFLDLAMENANNPDKNQENPKPVVQVKRIFEHLINPQRESQVRPGDQEDFFVSSSSPGKNQFTSEPPTPPPNGWQVLAFSYQQKLSTQWCDSYFIN